MKKGAFVTIVITIFGTIAALLNQSTVNTLLPPMMTDFHISASTAQWLTTVFALVTGIVVPVTAYLIRRYSTRQVFIAALGLLTVGTFLCAAAPGFGLLIAGRIVQAIGAGIMLPLLQTLVITLVPGAKRGFYMGIVGLAVSFAPAAGPVLSGWLVHNHSWRLLFELLGMFALLLLVIGLFAVRNVTAQAAVKLDVFSVLLSSLGFGGVLFGFSLSGTRGWSDAVTWGAIIVGAFSLGLFVWRQWTKANPLLELRVFNNTNFTMGTSISMILMIVMLSTQLLLPLYMQTMLGYSPLKAGLMLLPGAIVNGVMSPIAGKLFDRLGGKLVISIGLLITLVTSLMFAHLTVTTSYAYLIVVYAIRMAGISLCLMPSVTTSMSSLPPALISHGVPVNTTVRTIAGAIGTALLVAMMTYYGGNGDSNGMIQGMNAASLVTAVTAVIGLAMALMMKGKPAGVKAHG
ncbi:DHA2 family efflux MFS transporter permease subunit [Paenibacillus oryzisoli]|uniref:DHA2 family efflux MFS transporter permease subunit n=1 Tax=Paenibacillus oryzisoli TaxID=1850517 RepID=UPI003D2D3970